MVRYDPSIPFRPGKIVSAKLASLKSKLNVRDVNYYVVLQYVLCVAVCLWCQCQCLG